MIGVQEADRQYRRGVVLGLTMAEIMLLLIFLLLLILAAKLIEAKHDRDLAIDARTKAEVLRDELQRELTELRRKDPEKYDIAKEWRKIEAAKAEAAEAETAMELLEEVKKDKPKLTTREAADEVTRLAHIGREMEQKAQKLSPKATPEEALKHLANAAEAGDAVLKSGESPEEFLNGAAMCTKDLQQCKESNVSIRQQLAQNGGTWPDCWIDPLTGKNQYIFTAYIRNDGIYLEDNKVKNREADQAALPIAPLAFGRAYEAAEFVAAGMELYDWGRKQPTPCRFYVRQVDQLENNDKARFRYLSEKGVQGIFFILPSN